MTMMIMTAVVGVMTTMTTTSDETMTATGRGEDADEGGRSQRSAGCSTACRR
jgi:hypothetical protein